MSDKLIMPGEANGDCPTCNGWVRSDSGKWVRRRETVGLVCQTCGTDYGKASR